MRRLRIRGYIAAREVGALRSWLRALTPTLGVPATRSRSRRGLARYATLDGVTRIVHVPYAVEQDEDGVWCASAQIRPGVGAVGDGPTREAAVADLRDALAVLLAEVGPPEELTLALDVA